jgi:hypothetical protein
MKEKEVLKAEKKTYRVIATKCHIGIHHFAGALTVEAEKHKAPMELHPAGVIAHKTPKLAILIPYTNVTHIELAVE